MKLRLNRDYTLIGHIDQSAIDEIEEYLNKQLVNAKIILYPTWFRIYAMKETKAENLLETLEELRKILKENEKIVVAYFRPIVEEVYLDSEWAKLS